MSADTENSTNSSPKRFDGHKLSEFVYGTVAGMVAISGLDGGHGASWLQTGAIILFGSAAIWLAHSYALLVGHRIASAQQVTGRDLANFLSGSWPIVVAGFVLCLPLPGTALGIWSLSTALRISGFLGLAMLALVGILSGIASKETWPRRLFLAFVSTALGLFVLIVELLAHH